MHETFDMVIRSPLMTQQTRDDAIHALAMNLLLLDGKEWLRSPNSIQSEKQSLYLDRARKIIEFVENAMADFRWKAPPTNSPISTTGE